MSNVTVVPGFAPPKSTAVPPLRRAEAKKLDPKDPVAQRMMSLWCMDHGLKNQYTRHYRLFLECRGEYTRKKNPDKYCTDCNGKEEYVCDICDIGQMVEETCSVCSGTKTVPCERCQATGEIPCTTCNGKGSYEKTLYLAGAKGKAVKKTVQCRPTVPCPRCKGSNVETCNKCMGTGMEKKPCPVCDKHRFRRCPTCAPKKEVFLDRVRESYLATKDTTPVHLRPEPDPKDTKGKGADGKKTEDPAALDADALIKKGDSLLAKGLELDKESLASEAPYPLMKKAVKYYTDAVNCYQSAEKKGKQVEKKLKEASSMLFWLKSIMPSN